MGDGLWSDHWSAPPRGSRGQTTLAGLAVALVLLTTVTAGSIVAADRALSDATDTSLDRARADRAATALVTDSPVVTSHGYVDAQRANETNATELAAAIPTLRGVAFSVRFDGDEIAARGDVSDSVHVSRGVVVADYHTDSESIDVDGEDATTLDGRTGRIEFDVDPGANTTVRTIRVGDRVVLHRPTGIEGTHSVNVSSHAAPVIRVDVAGPAPAGTVTATARVFETRTGRIEVAVDA
ncbi:hypothetical protein GJR96_02300 [Haloferax sp. MBLA0076]|uniref:Uncharacterized protein n=1 Tax=Haloferax litoreum TaxID=2666140 RepID=A0A6A8GCJ6_9EURY|nr:MULTISPECIES: hypothetical protein [Haloferax]KAB1192333.1 hypothetical protein Hfx1148_02285 [Haloferax sp. CBA1148]MRX20795.1 hypothetical protein [Haloferax litoreum]